MKRSTAKSLVELTIKQGAELNSFLSLAEQVEDRDDFMVLKRIIGSIMGSQYFEIMLPISEMYPDLIPDKFRNKDNNLE